jgi:polar amino acid transport system permease protein
VAEKWDWDFAWDILPDLLRGLGLTVRITLAGTVVAMVLGLVLALLRRSSLRVVSWPTAFVIEFIRSTPLLVQLFFLYFVLPQSGGPALEPFTAGVIGLGVHYATYTSEVYRAGIDGVDRGQWEASTALNLDTRTTWGRIVLPQAIPNVIPALGNYLVAMFKDAPILVSITLLGVLGEARAVASQTFRYTEAYTLAGVLFLAVSIPAAAFVRFLEKRLRYERT